MKNEKIPYFPQFRISKIIEELDRYEFISRIRVFNSNNNLWYEFIVKKDILLDYDEKDIIEYLDFCWKQIHSERLNFNIAKPSKNQISERERLIKYDPTFSG